jgi:hypothetical protein
MFGLTATWRYTPLSRWLGDSAATVLLTFDVDAETPILAAGADYERHLSTMSHQAYVQRLPRSWRCSPARAAGDFFVRPDGRRCRARSTIRGRPRGRPARVHLPNTNGLEPAERSAKWMGARRWLASVPSRRATGRHSGRRRR